MEGTGSAASPGNEVLLGLGANLGRPIEQLRTAVARLAEYVERLRVSSLYRSAAVGHTDQPDFYNVVCIGRTRLGPPELLAVTQRIERRLGRTRSFPDAPRTMDVDILAYDDQLLDSLELRVPHPRLPERAFVLVPLAEVAPEWRHPRLGLTAAEMLSATGPLERIERLGGLYDL